MPFDRKAARERAARSVVELPPELASSYILDLPAALDMLDEVERTILDHETHLGHCSSVLGEGYCDCLDERLLAVLRGEGK